MRKMQDKKQKREQTGILILSRQSASDKKQDESETVQRDEPRSVLSIESKKRTFNDADPWGGFR